MPRKPLMRDRLMRGGLAGMIGGIWLFVWNEFSYDIIHFAKTLWTDALSQLVLGHQVKGAMDFIVAVFLCADTGKRRLADRRLQLDCRGRVGYHLGLAYRALG